MPSQNYVQTLKNKFFIKRDDTLPSLCVQLIDTACLGEKVPFNLSGVTGITFTMVNKAGEAQIAEVTAQIVSYTGGTIAYNGNRVIPCTKEHSMEHFNYIFQGPEADACPFLRLET